MKRVAAAPTPIRQSSLIQVASNTALNVTGVATFVPCLYLLWVGRGSRDWREWAIYAAALSFGSSSFHFCSSGVDPDGTWPGGGVGSVHPRRRSAHRDLSARLIGCFNRLVADVRRQW